ncbi:MAG: fumarate hydratase [Rhodospirillales bacterium]|nr:fumarate hydratase [Rhodospirillales bacterium]
MSPDKLRIDPQAVEEAAKLLYIRALKVLPDDVKTGFRRLDAAESDGTAKAILATMIENIAVAERTDNLLCQDTGIPIFNVEIGREVDLDGVALKAAIRRGVARATREYPLRSSVVHPITRVNEHTSCGRGVPVINIDFVDRPGALRLEMIPKGSGSENGSFLRMLIPADGLDGVKKFVIDCVMQAGGKVCPPTIVGVGLGGDSTAFAVHVETAATHITMNPVAVNIQCHSARRATAIFTAKGVEIGF